MGRPRCARDAGCTRVTRAKPRRPVFATSVKGHRKCPISREGDTGPYGDHGVDAFDGETSRAAPGWMALERSAWRRMR